MDHFEKKDKTERTNPTAQLKLEKSKKANKYRRRHYQ